MNWCDRANIIRRFHRGRDTVGLVRWRRAEAMPEVERTIKDGFRMLLIDRGVSLINDYHEAGETDEAFEALRRNALALVLAADRVGQGREVIDDLILTAVRMKVEQMYDEGTAERLLVAFECGFGRTGRPKFLRV